jgi:uncharacterized protein YbjT (DUF2867 family)
MYVIAGASGRTGSVAAEALLAAHQPVRVVVRHADKGGVWRAVGADVRAAAFESRSALAQAFDGAQGIYVLLPFLRSGVIGGPDYWRSVSRSLAAAVRDARPPHVVALSCLGAGHASAAGSLGLLRGFEQDLAGTGTPVTFLRAAWFMQNLGPAVLAALGGGTLFTVQAPEQKAAMAAVRDVGALAADLLRDPIHSGIRIVELGGPEDYSPNRAAAILSRVAGRHVRAAQVTADALAGMPGDVSGLLTEVTAVRCLGETGWNGAGTVRLRGKVPLEAVLRDIVRSHLAGKTAEPAGA